MTRPVDVSDWRPIVGTVAQVRDAVAAARATGRLEEMTYPRRVRGREGVVCVHIRLRAPEPVPVPPAARRWPLVVAGAAVLTVSTALILLAVAWVVAHWALLLGAAVVALVLMAVLARIRG